MKSRHLQCIHIIARVALMALIALMAVSVCEARTKKVDDWRNPDIPKYTKETKPEKVAGMDGVIVLFYTGGGVKDSYVRSDYYLQYEGTATSAGYYNWGQPYFVDVYSVQKGEGYSDYTTVNYVESTYYDLKTEQPVWRIVTETTDRKHSDAAMEIAKKIASEMNSAGL